MSPAHAFASEMTYVLGVVFMGAVIWLIVLGVAWATARAWRAIFNRWG